MSHLKRISFAAVAIATCAFSAILVAQDPPPPRQAPPRRIPAVRPPVNTNPAADLAGMWQVVDTPRNNPEGIGRRRFLRGEPPRLPWAEEQYQTARKGVDDFNEQGRDDMDPLDACFPPSAARLANLPRPFELITGANNILMLSEWDHWVRYIWTDGRTHDASGLTGFMGHSIGTWEGNTLVVDTVDMLGDNWIDGVGNPQTDQMHIVERFRRVDHDNMEIDYLFEDPKAYTKPWGGKKMYRLHPEIEIIEHVVCQDFLKLGKKR